MKTAIDELLPYVASKSELLEQLTDYTVERWDDSNMIAFYDTNSKVGLFPMSDFICIYDDNDQPISVTERLYKKNCSLIYWIRMSRMLRNKVNKIRQEMGYNICVTFDHDYLDYSHYKQTLYDMLQHE